MTTRKPSTIMSVEQLREKKRALKVDLQSIDRAAREHHRALGRLQKARAKAEKQLNSLSTAVGVKRA